jgi:coatomer subunit beta
VNIQQLLRTAVDPEGTDMRLDLQHANEYIRGNTLRFVTKLNDAELIEPLLAPARQCLEHR